MNPAMMINNIEDELLGIKTRLLHFLEHMVGKQIAEDLLQESFERAIKSFDTFKGSSTVKTWVFRIANNLAIDHIRKKNREAKHSFEAIAVTGDEIEGMGAFFDIIDERSWNLPAETFDRKEMINCIAEFISQLQPTMKSTILLREIEGVPIEEMADILQITKENVRIRIYRSRKVLRKALADGCHVYQGRNGGILCEKK